MMFEKKIGEVEYRDTALAFIFMCFLLWLAFDRVYFLYAAMGILLAAMIVPKSMKYPAKAWYGFSLLLGTFVSKIILGIAYIVLVVPIGLLRQVLGKDPMGFKSWRNGEGSAFVVRNHRYVKEDFENQF